MKQLKNNFQKSFAFTLATALIISLFQFLGVQTPSALAANLAPRDYSIGPGASPRASHARFFYVPAGGIPTAKVTFQRLGITDIPITIELENPDGDVVATIDKAANGGEREWTLTTSSPSNKGCNPPWKVRVKSRDGQTPLAKVFGKITFSFTDPGPTTSGPSQAFGVIQDNTVERSFDDPTSPGNLKITATWHSPMVNWGGSDLSGLRLKFELFQGNTRHAQSDGYAHNAGGIANPKMTINYKVTSNDISAGGDWKLKVTGSPLGNSSDVKFTTTFTPRCQ